MEGEGEWLKSCSPLCHVGLLVDRRGGGGGGRGRGGRGRSVSLERGGGGGCGTRGRVSPIVREGTLGVQGSSTTVTQMSATRERMSEVIVLLHFIMITPNCIILTTPTVLF